MKPCYTNAASLLTCITLLAASANGQVMGPGAPSVLAHSAGQLITSQPATPANVYRVDNAAPPYAYATAPTYVAPPSYRVPYTYTMPQAFPRQPAYAAGATYPASAMPMASYQQQPGRYQMPVAQQPFYSSGYGVSTNWTYPQPPVAPSYWPTATGQHSVMLHSSNMVGEPPAAQPAPQAHTHAHTKEPLWTDAYAAGYADTCVSCATPRPRNWFGTASGLYMTRDHGNHYTFSYGTLAEDDQRTNTRDATMGWSYGFDVRFGRYFNCGRNAVEAVYWGIFPEREATRTVSADVTGNLNAILDFSVLTYGGISADNYVNVAGPVDGIHYLQREFEFHNVEVNLWQFCTTCSGGSCECSRFRFNWLAGIRFFRFNENLLFGADANDTQITYEADEIFYNIDIDNDLIGFQLGNELQYCLSRRLTLDLAIKLGVYGNYINHASEIGGSQGVATINTGPFNTREFSVNNSKEDVAFLGEAKIGLEYCINPCWTATFGYQAFAVTGVALPSDQIYHDLRGINDVEIVDSNGSLILHGGYVGLEYGW